MLVKATQDGDLEVVLRLLYTNPFIGQQELRDSVWEAVRGCRLEVLRSLLEFRVDPGCEPSQSLSAPPPPLRRVRWTPLLSLAVNGSHERAEIVAELLAAGQSLQSEPRGGSSSSSRAERADCKKAIPDVPFKKLAGIVQAPGPVVQRAEPATKGYSPVQQAEQPKQGGSAPAMSVTTLQTPSQGKGLMLAVAGAATAQEVEARLGGLRAEELAPLETELEALLSAVRAHRQRCLEQQLQSVQRKHDEACKGWQSLEEEQSCVVCSELEKTILFLPCRHLCTCRECADQLLLCPICRADIVEKVQCIRP
eukprot:TRINITY_DN51066_c0_g1_i1.p1 TRINITY_DN51066_c0_g1~~TRINITY_DN51066_c0_g1_i1.p1  ORF type:complete len:309 (+),score=77.86 TRINITY_DN51066_c0_g1_i1:47-973(+)